MNDTSKLNEPKTAADINTNKALTVNEIPNINNSAEKITPEAPKKSFTEQSDNKQRHTSKQFDKNLQEAKNDNLRIYSLRGFTSVAKVEHKFKTEARQKFLYNLLSTLIVVLALIALLIIYNPFKTVSDINKLTGKESFFNEYMQSSKAAAKILPSGLKTSTVPLTTVKPTKPSTKHSS